MSNRDKLITLQGQLGWRNKTLQRYLQCSKGKVDRMRGGVVPVKDYLIELLNFKLMEMNK